MDLQESWEDLAKKFKAKADRIERLKSGDWSFGCAGTHVGVGTPECPKEKHHHHDEFCKYPSLVELAKAGIDVKDFRVRSRA